MEGNQGNNTAPWPPPVFPVPPSTVQQGAFFYFSPFYPVYIGPNGTSVPLPTGDHSVRDFYGQASAERPVHDFLGQTTGERSVRDFCGQTTGERSVRDFCGQTTGERSVRDFCGQASGERSVRDFRGQDSRERSVRDFGCQTSDERSVRDFGCQTAVEVQTSDVSTQTSYNEPASSGQDLALQRPLSNHLGSTTAEKAFAIVQNGRSRSLTPVPEETKDGNVESLDLHGPWHYESGIFCKHVDGGPMREVCRVVKEEHDVTGNGVDQLLSNQPDQQQDSVPQTPGEPPVDAGNHAVIHEPDELAQEIKTADVAMEASPDPSTSQRSMTTKISYFDIEFHGPFRYECGPSRLFLAGRLRMEQVASPVDPHPSKRPRTEIPSSAAEMEDLMVEIWSEIDGKGPEKRPFLKRITPDMLEEALCDLNIKRDPKKLQTRKTPRRGRTRKCC